MNLHKDFYLLTFVLGLTILNLTCKNEVNERENEYINSITESFSISSEVKWLIILPGMGCNGCIQEGEAFMKEFIDNNEILFILTNVSSLKILQHKTGIQIKEHPNIYIDKENKIVIPTDNKIYPCIIHLEENKIKSYEFQSPINGNAFRKVKNMIKACK